MFERFHGLVGVSLAGAAERATEFGHTEITSGHAVLGMAADERTSAAAVLASLDLDVDRLADAVRSVRPQVPYDRHRHVPLDASLKATLYQVAQGAARRDTVAGTHELLLALFDAPEPEAREVLSRAGVSVQSVRTSIADYVRSGHAEVEPENTVRVTASMAAATPVNQIPRFERRAVHD